MSGTTAQCEANRRNAESSTGPVTAAGKARSRGNAVKHGLSGSGAVLPAELAAAFERQLAAWTRSIRPRDETERRCVRDLALAAARLDRCRELEPVLEAEHRRRDLARWDDDRREAAERLGLGLAAQPRLVTLQLQATNAGCDWLIERWQLLDAGLEGGSCAWTNADLELVLDLLGRLPALRHLDPVARRLGRLCREARGDGAEAAAASTALRAEIAAEIDRLDDRAAALRAAVEDPERAALEADLRFDDSPSMRNLRRLETAARRAFDRALVEIDDHRAGQSPDAPDAAFDWFEEDDEDDEDDFDEDDDDYDDEDLDDDCDDEELDGDNPAAGRKTNPPRRAGSGTA